MIHDRNYSFIDQVCLGVDQAIRALSGHSKTSGILYPAEKVEEVLLSDTEQKHSAGLMRINHTGEICAQALYHGQAMVSKSISIQEKMIEAAIEEGDHLNWCHKRLDELNSHTSYLNPLWYFGSFGIGVAAGLAGDPYSLGFVAETEKQVIKHLEGHLALLPKKDKRSAIILEKMEADEARHRNEAIALGAKDLPKPIQFVMRVASQIMVKLTYWI
jgi:ubiquinone biosynthesis monooxygenase Coq7